MILGLKEDKQGELEKEFPNHEFKVINLVDKPKLAGKLKPKYFDLVIAMTYYLSHQAERVVRNNLMGTQFTRVPGSISHLKTVLKDL